MIRIRKILFPTDFSSSSQQALLYVLYLAQKYRAELHMLHAIVLHEEDPHNPAHHFPDIEQVHERLKQLATDQMRAFIEEHDLADLIVKQVQRRDISAAPSIVEYAEEEDIDLIVMGTHGRRGIRKLLLGSVAAEVIRMAPCPVLAVRSERDALPLAEIKRILVPIDFSKHAKEALVVACNVASIYDAELQLLHVLENVLHPAFYNMGATSITDLQPDILERTEASLQNLFEQTTDCQEKHAGFFALEGHAGRDIVRFAENHDSDLIVIATHGLTGLEQFLMGSTADKVIRRALCPVLVVKAFQKSLVA